MSKLVPLYDRVLLRQEAAPEETKGGILIPVSGQERPMRAVILATGEGRWADGLFMPPTVRAGERVMFSKFAGVKIRCSDYHPDQHEEELIIMRENEILGVLREDIL